MSALENGVGIGSSRPEERRETTEKEIYNKYKLSSGDVELNLLSLVMICFNTPSIILLGVYLKYVLKFYTTNSVEKIYLTL